MRSSLNATGTQYFEQPQSIINATGNMSSNYTPGQPGQREKKGLESLLRLNEVVLRLRL